LKIILIFSIPVLLLFSIFFGSVFAHSGHIFDAYVDNPPIIDGVENTNEWSQADSFEYDITVSDQNMNDLPLHVKLSVMNDENNLYVLAKITGQSDVNWNTSWSEYRFDSNHNLEYENTSEDKLVMWTNNADFQDTNGEGGLKTDVDRGGTIDGQGEVGGGTTFQLVEVSHPLCSGDSQDFCLKPGDVTGFSFGYSVYSEQKFWPSPIITNYADIRIAGSQLSCDYVPTIEIDQKTYTWTDKVYITVISPCENSDSKSVDVIDPENPITIQTNSYDLLNYRLIETGTDTGIFTGEIVLTGFIHDADGDGKIDTKPSTGGIGPNNGLIEASNNDQLTITYNHVNGIISASASIRWNNGELQWLESSYPVDGASVIRLIDPDMNLDPNYEDNFHIDVWSSSKPVSTKILLTETNEATGIFEGTISISSIGSAGDVITAQYLDYTPSLDTKTKFLEVKSTATVQGTQQPPPSGTDIMIPVGTFTPGCETTNSCFTPYNLEIYVGDTVIWYNADTAAHTVTSGGQPSGPNGIFDSGLFMSGNSFSHTFDSPDTFDYFCMVHPWMTGQVVVSGADFNIIPIPKLSSDQVGPNILLIDFFNVDNDSVQKHIDYRILVKQNGQNILNTPLTHTATGKIQAPITINNTDQLDVTITIEGVLFQPVFPSEHRFTHLVVHDISLQPQTMQDKDGDGIEDAHDNCPGIYNADQTDSDGDGLGNVCDSTPYPQTMQDKDGDGIEDAHDNCPGIYNADQTDSDGDGLGNVCDSTPYPQTMQDKDGDAVNKNTEIIVNKLSDVAKPIPISEPKIDTAIFELQRSEDPESFAKQNDLLYEDGKTKLLLNLASLDRVQLNKLKEIATIDSTQDNLAQITIPVESLSSLADLESVVFAAQPTLALQQGIVSEGVEFVKADYVNQLAGLTGKGIKIAVLDLAFDTTNPEIQKHISESKSFRKGYTGTSIPVKGYDSQYVHGTAVAEIIVDVAPDVRLYLYTFGTELEFLDAIEYAKSRVDVITTSTGWVNYPTDGTSAMTRKVQDVISSGIPFVISAGNYANMHWEGILADSDKNGWMEFPHGDEGLTINVSELDVSSGTPLMFYLIWNDINSDYDILLLDPSGEAVAYSANNKQSKIHKEAIKFVPVISGQYHLAISGNTHEKNPVEIFSPTYAIEHYVKKSSVGVPNDAAGVISVGALDHTDGQLESFSSQGPTNNGNLAPIIMGPDNVETYAYSGYPFIGTSAAAPHVAGVVALMIEKNSDFEPHHIVFGLTEFANKSAVSLITPYNNTYGHGRVDATFLLSDENISVIQASTQPEQLESKDVLETQETSQAMQQSLKQEQGGCLIATATYGTELAPQVQQLRELRDNHLLQSESGKSFMEPFNHIYYSFSPTIADWERQNPFFKEAVKITITPMISSLSLLNHVSMDSEAEVIVYGTSLILLNLGMYIGVPAAIITSLRKSVI